MTQSPRLHPHHGGTAPTRPGRGPETPRRLRPRNALDELIASLEADYQLGLLIRDETWSPHKTAGSLGDEVQRRLRQLYYTARPALDHTLAEFKAKAERLPLPSDRLNLLSLLLRTQPSSPLPTRVTRSQTPRDEAIQSPCGETAPTGAAHSKEFRIRRDDEPGSRYLTAPQRESPATDEDEWSPPPSPSIANRRSSNPWQGQASSRTLWGLKGKKRPSKSSDKVEKSHKLTKISKGPRPAKMTDLPIVVTYPSLNGSPIFKKPETPAIRSVHATYARTPFITSFGSNTTGSSQQSSRTQPDTALTSFNSEYGGWPSESPHKTRRTSFTTNGSSKDVAMLEATSKLQKAASGHASLRPRDSSTTYGSLDEEDLIHTSSDYGEAMSNNVLQLLPNQSPRSRPVEATSSRHIHLKAFDSNTSSESPTKLPHYIRNIPQQNLFIGDIDKTLKGFPYFILFICQRLALEHSIPLLELMSGMDPDVVPYDPGSFWNSVDSHPRITSRSGRESNKVWAAATDHFDNFTFKAKVTFNNRRVGPVFNLKLLPIQSDKSCRFQRKFGASRFLYITFPSLGQNSQKPDRFTNEQMTQIRTQWLEWFDTEHHFLGRKWKAFHVEPTNRRKGSKRDEASNGVRVVLFATEGLSLDLMSVGDMVNWFFPFAENKSQTVCKAFARLDLGLSRTVPTLAFKPWEVEFVEDIKANDEVEDCRYNDPNILEWPEAPDQAVMNDGCALISLGAAQEVWRIYKKRTGLNDEMPTAFQARIGGSKGLWIVDSKREGGGPQPIWIQISKSQLKFNPHPQDKTELFDELRLTFEIVNYTANPTPSELHISFVPILVDRGVPPRVVQKIMRDRLDKEREDLMVLLCDPVRIYDWVQKQSAGTKELDNMLWQAGLPSLLPDKIKLLLESGLSPTEEPYLGKTLARFIKQQHLWEEQKLRIPLGKSTFLYGVADPYGVLAPGEIHVRFGKYFLDEMTEESFRCLDFLDVLIARQPACRRSDIQKVRVVSHPGLSHMLNVVVFPSRGKYPLAGKLQGGDYDGDIFWTCWDPELVIPFMNAPAPLDALDPAKYGIRQDTTSLPDVMDPHNLSTVSGFLQQAVSFRMNESLLGQVTNYLTKRAYQENCVYSKTLDALCDMHDLLVDAPKQGYDFTIKEFAAAKKNLGIRRDPGIPAYQKAMEECTSAKEMGEAEKLLNREWPFNQDNVIDYLYFGVVREHHVKTQRKVNKFLSKEVNDDTDLQYPYELQHKMKKLSVDHELKSLVRGFERIHTEWATALTKNNGNTTSDEYNAALDKCYGMYRSLLPNNTAAAEIAFWTEPYIGRDCTMWESLRASALYCKFPRNASFVYHMAGKELAELKAGQSKKTRRVVGPIYSILKPKLEKTVIQIGSGGEEEADEEDEETVTPKEESI